MADDPAPHAEAVAHAVESYRLIHERAAEAARRLTRRGRRRNPDRWEPHQ